MDDEGRRWATEGGSNANEIYLGSRLQYQDIDPRVAGDITGEMVKTVFMRFLAAYAALLLLGLLTAVFGLTSLGYSESIFDVKLPAVLAILPWLVFVIPQRFPINEWGVLLDDKAAAAESAYSHIFTSLKKRQSPVKATARRVRTGVAPPTQGYYLIISQDRYRGYVSVFGYGRDLFVGWTMWWSLVPIVMIALYVGQKISALFGQNSFFHQILRGDQVKALREVIHSASREGVDAATAGLELSLQDALGYVPPLETIEAGGSPPGGMPPRHVPTPPKPQRPPGTT